MASRFQKLRQLVRQRRRLHQLGECTIALDAMGTDHGPEVLLEGAFLAVTQYPTLSVICTGPQGRLRSILRHHGWQHPRLHIVDAPEVVGMHEAPSDSLRKRNSSVAVAARLVLENRAQGMVSAGNTGATMATTLLMWRTLPGISRPAISAILPHPDRPCVLLDVGANVDCKPRHLLHFAIMGSVYSRYMFYRRHPKVALLSIGEEETKGNELVLAARELLAETNLNFAGNAEGRDLVKGKFDVVVCDGFVGNIVLKFGEAVVEFIIESIKQEVQKSLVSQLGAVAMMPALRNFKRQVDYAEFGGAPLLGVRGNCIIAHGSSHAKAIKNAIRVAAEMAEAHVNDHIVEAMRENGLLKGAAEAHGRLASVK
ncbi:MAG: phosphate acyltransferase PlsX [Candidatus Sumerlaeaceae bacterium]|nr:phosphate acyltransferase PlsX [Candidatus Sumerlaeaceae bacterium]